MTARDMNRRPDPLDHLADALAEDILAAPAERMLAETAADHGDGAALAAAFDSVAVRAARRSRSRRRADRIAALAAMLAAQGSWRPAMAAVAGLAIVAVAGDLYWHVRPPVEPLPAAHPSTIAAPGAQEPVRRHAAAVEPAPAPAQERAAGADSSVASAAIPPALPPPPQDQPRRVKTVVIGAGSGPRNLAEAPPAVGSPVIDGRLRGLLDHERVRASERIAPAASQRAPQAGIAPALAPLPTSPRPSAAPASFDWPLRGRVLARFGRAGDAAPNDGIDLAAPTGTDVRAAADGVVLYAGGADKGFGNLILVSHTNGFLTVYGYASRILVRATDQVRRGQVIAKSGASGEAPAPALHFEIRKDAAPVDPAQYLPPG